jgi:hypothetical protein
VLLRVLRCLCMWECKDVSKLEMPTLLQQLAGWVTAQQQQCTCRQAAVCITTWPGDAYGVDAMPVGILMMSGQLSATGEVCL